MVFSKQQIIGIIGALLLIIGVFLPVISVPMLGQLSLFNNGRSDGAIILALSILCFIIIFFQQFRAILIISFVILSILGYDLYQFKSTLNKVRQETSAALDGNPFQGLGNAMIDSIQLQYGWAVLFIGCIILIISVIYKENSQQANNSDSQVDQKQSRKVIAHDPFQFNTNTNSTVQTNNFELKPCPFCDEMIRITAIKCKHCGSMLENNEN